MIIVDTNLLIYAYNSHSPHHAKAVHWFEILVNSCVEIGFAEVKCYAWRTAFNRELQIHYRLALYEHLARYGKRL